MFILIVFRFLIWVKFYLCLYYNLQKIKIAFFFHVFFFDPPFFFHVE